MSVLHDYTALERDMCFLLAEHDDPSGHDLGDPLDELYSSGASQSSVYPVLKTLRSDGLVEKRESEGYGSAYVLTEAGREAVREYSEWVEERVPDE